jgi:hypothetical protein
LLDKIDYLGTMSIHQRIAEEEVSPKGDCDPLSESPSEEPKGREKEALSPPLEPTRFGDWERAGRCIDF